VRGFVGEDTGKGSQARLPRGYLIRVSPLSRQIRLRIAFSRRRPGSSSQPSAPSPHSFFRPKWRPISFDAAAEYPLESKASSFAPQVRSETHMSWGLLGILLMEREYVNDLTMRFTTTPVHSLLRARCPPKLRTSQYDGGTVGGMLASRLRYPSDPGEVVRPRQFWPAPVSPSGLCSQHPFQPHWIFI
jgi:hypothetical protein